MGKKGVVFVLLAVTSLFALAESAWALPAFALKEKTACTMCHTNGSAPHLTKIGYLYRRAGFRFPWDIGNKDKDDKAMNITSHLAAGSNLTYNVGDNQPPGATKASLLDNEFGVPEVELWPLVGGFFGNFGAWTEIDADLTKGLALGMADLRYVRGNKDFWFNFRGGLLSSEGYGASDQWFDDANIPLFDQLSPYYNQDTLVLPFGAMGQPELGAEVGVNYYDTHLTLGMYNGFYGSFDPSLGTGPQTNTLNPVIQSTTGQKDYKVQLDQFLGENFEFTAGYYNGSVPLIDSAGTNWTDGYSEWRLYVTYSLLPSTLDLLAGGAFDMSQYTNPGTGVSSGTFNTDGVFLGAMYYAMPHVSFAARFDFDQYNTTPDSPFSARGMELMASFPFDNNIFVIHYNMVGSDLGSNSVMANAQDTYAGLTHSLRAEWRFLF